MHPAPNYQYDFTVPIILQLVCLKSGLLGFAGMDHSKNPELSPKIASSLDPVLRKTARVRNKLLWISFTVAEILLKILLRWISDEVKGVDYTGSSILSGNMFYLTRMIRESSCPYIMYYHGILELKSDDEFGIRCVKRNVKQNINLIIGFYFLQVQKIWKDETRNGLGPSQTPGGTKFLVFALGHFSNTKVVLFDVTKSFFDIFFQYMYHYSHSKFYQWKFWHTIKQ